MNKKKYVIITADTNDADFITEKTLINNKDLKFIKKVAKAISECKSEHNWPSSEYEDEYVSVLYEDVLTEAEIDRFSDFVPYGEYGVHTIESIEILVVEEEYSLL